MREIVKLTDWKYFRSFTADGATATQQGVSPPADSIAQLFAKSVKMSAINQSTNELSITQLVLTATTTTQLMG